MGEGICRVLAASDKGLDAFFEFAARQKNAALARLANDANVCA
jgi:hypothetical protein